MNQQRSVDLASNQQHACHLVLVCDDDPAVRDSLELLLEAADYDVETFEDAHALLEHVTPSTTACLLVDVRMPGMDGLELQAELKRRDVPLPVIIVTGHGDVPMAVKAMSLGASDFIEKPFEEEALLSSVERGCQLAAEARRDADAVDVVKTRLERLTPREHDVLEQLVIGNPNKVIAHELGLSPRTVEIHRARVMEKLEARNLSHLVRMALAAGLTPVGGEL